MTFEQTSHHLATLVRAELPAVAAAGAGVLAVVGGRVARRRFILEAAGVLAAVAGVTMLLGWTGLARRLVSPAGPLDALLLPALLGLLIAAFGARATGRAGRALPFAFVAFGAWWLAGAATGRAEFWRVWAAGAALGWLLARATAGEPCRILAAALGLWLALVAGGAPAAWSTAALVGTVAALTYALADIPGRGPIAGGRILVSLVALVVMGADLGAGRLVRGGLGPIDAACAAPVVAGLLVKPASRRLQFLGRGRTPAAVVVAAALAAAAVWVAGWLLTIR